MISHYEAEPHYSRSCRTYKTFEAALTAARTRAADLRRAVEIRAVELTARGRRRVYLTTVRPDGTQFDH